VSGRRRLSVALPVRLRCDRLGGGAVALQLTLAGWTVLEHARVYQAQTKRLIPGLW
jgi:hypothetical protein